MTRTKLFLATSAISFLEYSPLNNLVIGLKREFFVGI